MATILPLKRRPGKNIHRASHVLRNSAALVEECLRTGDARESAQDTASMVFSRKGDQIQRQMAVYKDWAPKPPTQLVGGGSLTQRQWVRWTWAPVILDCAVTPLAFHHFLHGVGGRANLRRRPLLVFRGLSETKVHRDGLIEKLIGAARQQRRQLDANQLTSSSSSSSSWFTAADPLLLPAPVMAVTKVIGADMYCQREPLVGESHDGFEAMLTVATPALLRVHDRDLPQRRRDAAATLDPALAGEKQANMKSFTELTVNPGDLLYLPRTLKYDLVPPPRQLQEGRPQSIYRSSKVIPLDIGPNPAPPATVTLASCSTADLLRMHDTDGEKDNNTQHNLVAWRWRFANFPDFTDRDMHFDRYVAANHMTDFTGLYAATSAARR
jgi:hypothetical protein